MKDEIKEILKDNDELMVIYKDNSFESFDTLPINVLDYITSLEQENKRLKEINEINNDEDYIYTYEELQDKILKLQKEYKELKSRIDKAVENTKQKIKGYKETIDMLITTNVENKRYEIAELKYRIREQEELLNILTGGDE